MLGIMVVVSFFFGIDYNIVICIGDNFFEI